ncbi:unnamed protein product [Caenorhabditis auriculariae]|uniref:UDP-glucuronosyltransferase n=1 Tax=Caenorhabditis auriculariae TaxID=2777116 RepID=A0A8S1H7Y5_9PELO|nr:unnamed protein product [Caenorhabditis auriculariae]
MADVQTSGTSLAKVKRIEFGMEEEISSVMVKVHSKIWDDFGPSDYLRLVTLMSSSFVKFCEEILTSQELKQWMSEHEFDVIISEMLFCFHGCPKTTHITISATNPMEWMTEAFMIPNAPALVPGNSSPLTPKMNMIQKTFLGDSSYLMVNSHEIIDFPRPITSQWIYIGGLRPPEPKGLDEWWSNTLSMRNYSSIVIVSFGSIAKASEMPSHVKQAYIDAMSALNDTLFIWKYEKPAHGFASELDNVVTKEWLPQVDLLHDPRITALITHAGISSIFEAVRAAKPLITVPLFADQMRNSEMLRYRGVSVALPKQATYHQIVNAVQKIHEKKFVLTKKLTIEEKVYSKTLCSGQVI